VRITAVTQFGLVSADPVNYSSYRAITDVQVVDGGQEELEKRFINPRIVRRFLFGLRAHASWWQVVACLRAIWNLPDGRAVAGPWLRAQLLGGGMIAFYVSTQSFDRPSDKSKRSARIRSARIMRAVAGRDACASDKRVQTPDYAGIIEPGSA